MEQRIVDREDFFLREMSQIHDAGPESIYQRDMLKMQYEYSIVIQCLNCFDFSLVWSPFQYIFIVQSILRVIGLYRFQKHHYIASGLIFVKNTLIFIMIDRTVFSCFIMVFELNFQPKISQNKKQKTTIHASTIPTLYEHGGPYRTMFILCWNRRRMYRCFFVFYFDWFWLKTIFQNRIKQRCVQTIMTTAIPID